MTREAGGTSMLDHVSIPVVDVARSAAFYDSVLRTVGLVRAKQRVDAIGYGSGPGLGPPCFWLLRRLPADSAEPGFGLHVSFRAPDRASVDAFYSAALAAGGRSVGSPGERPEYTQPFYGAFVLDLDGFKIEAVCRES